MKKIFVITAIMFIFLITITSNIYGAIPPNVDIETVKNTIVNDLNNRGENWAGRLVAYHEDQGVFYGFKYGTPTPCKALFNANNKLIIQFSAFGRVHVFTYTITGEYIDRIENYTQSSGSKEYNITPNDYIYSSHEVYNINGELVNPYQPVLAQIPAITEVAQIPEIMGKIIQVIIPVGLAVFGTGLLIYLIRSVISRVQ